MQPDQFDAVPQYSSKTIVLVTIFFLAIGAVVSFGIYQWQARLADSPASELPESVPSSEPSLDESMANDVVDPTTEQTKSVTDSANLFTIQIPQSWQVVSSQGSQGVQLSYLSIESPNFATHTDPDFEGPFEPIYYDRGANLTLHVIKGDEGSIHASDVLELKKIEIDGNQASWTRFVEPSTFNGELIDVNLNYQGNNYLIRMGYNPDTDPYGVAVFDQIVSSLKFL
jgi:hypothetical protein